MNTVNDIRSQILEARLTLTAVSGSRQLFPVLAGTPTEEGVGFLYLGKQAPFPHLAGTETSLLNLKESVPRAAVNELHDRAARRHCRHAFFATYF